MAGVSVRPVEGSEAGATTAPASSPSAPPPVRRDLSRRVVGGVCSGIGRRLGIDPVILRVGFVAAAVAGGVGFPLYAMAWAFVPAEGAERSAAARIRGRRESWQAAAGAGLLVLSGLLVFRELGIWFSDALVWPVVVAASGAALIWRQSTSATSAGSGTAAPSGRSSAPRAATAQMESAGASSAGSGTASAAAAAAADPPRVITGLPLRGGPALSRAGLGVVLVLGAGLIFLQANGALGALRDVLLAVVVVVIALGLILAPWWWRLVRNLTEERAERVRSQERAEMAAHLHDSVLQTLALVQRRAEDPREVAGLARRQERELRAWLSGRSEPQAGRSVSSALEGVAAEVEETHGVAIDVVSVGDGPVDDGALTVIAAAREALVNAARFAGEHGPVSVYAEVDDERLHVFVRDRGPGFDPAAVPADRRGVRESIIGRMQRRGGQATVHAAPGAGGTEVELVMDREPR